MNHDRTGLFRIKLELESRQNKQVKVKSQDSSDMTQYLYLQSAGMRNKVNNGGPGGGHCCNFLSLEHSKSESPSYLFPPSECLRASQHEKCRADITLWG